MTTEEPLDMGEVRAALMRRMGYPAYDGECSHGFGPPSSECPNEECDDREDDALLALLPASGVIHAPGECEPVLTEERLARALRTMADWSDGDDRRADCGSFSYRLLRPSEFAAAILAALREPSEETYPSPLP